MNLCIREASARDYEATRLLVIAAFHDNEPQETAVFLDSMRAENCIIDEWLAEAEGVIVGHVVFSRVLIATASGSQRNAAMLTPLAVRPDRQRQGVGQTLTRSALAALDARGEDLYLVLGHPAYYPRLGFSAELAKCIESPWGDTAAFMARSKTAPVGNLILPKSIAEAH